MYLCSTQKSAALKLKMNERWGGGMADFWDSILNVIEENT
jgi:hypothetical protein